MHLNNEYSIVNSFKKSNILDSTPNLIRVKNKIFEEEIDSDFPYLQSQEISILKNDFIKYMLKNGIDINNSTGGLKIREAIFEYFREDSFKYSYFKIATLVARSIGIPLKKLLLQMNPTPRIFRPGDHGTSFHCDYWYGHGEHSYTVWIPLTELDDANTFRICYSSLNDELKRKIIKDDNFNNIEPELIEKSYPARPPVNGAVIFNSKTLHGSPINSSDKERISFDFRIGQIGDESSTKKISNFYTFKNNRFVPEQNKFLRKRFLKYICGGSDKDTTSQHILIEAIAKINNINIVAQEAEIERFGQPMFKSYIKGLALEKKINGIVIASKNILNESSLNHLKGADLLIFCALENQFL